MNGWSFSQRCRLRTLLARLARPQDRQKGQVIPLTLVFLTALSLSLWVLYDAGQVNIEKMKLQNNADAGAYSTATMVARDLNFIAYMNRGMVANQVAIGQMVGLASWVEMMEQVAANIDTLGDILRYIPYIGAVIDAITTWFETSMEFADQAIDAAARVAIPINDSLIAGFSRAQVSYHAASTEAAAQVLNEVTVANDPHARHIASIGGISLVSVASMIRELEDMMGTTQISRPQTTSGSSSNDYALMRFKEFQSVVIASEDPFTYRRSYSWGSVDLGYMAIMIPRYGGSEFTMRSGTDGRYQWEWTAMDDVSIVTIIRRIVETETIETPFGWGAAHALNSGSSYYRYSSNRSRALYGKGAWKNPNSARLAASYNGSNNMASTREGGLRPFYDFKEDGTGYDVGPGVTVLLAKDDQYLQTQKAMDRNSTAFNVNAAENKDVYIEEFGGTSNAHITALSKAAPYFSRPHEANGSIDTWLRRAAPGLDSRMGPAKVPNGAENQVEHGNLYGPFWQARLVDTSDVERLAAIELSKRF